ncbi:DUF2461 domain-containing protein [Allorhodopirellula solitaria]|uniref:TIGR02453 family protein n=1 Tax=Allorhodopirellula solitaria TaxID=2527987 RepID=A0A5C5YF62_9BACT|nr:DUF2461 domain-containing protein [Allorhodopirellula solitaria]TWT74367.1 hypothetical protein CA85_12560 [Allorhodopirellula solitaria]
MTQASPIGPELFEFLDDLARNNQREWFHANKPRYEQDVREPALDLIEQLAVPLRRSAPMLNAVAKRSGGSLLRIHRDTRFSKDKTPYKTNVGISIRHQADNNIHAPGIYIHFSVEECLVAAGCWRPHRETLAAVRRAIDADPRAWHRARDAKRFRESFQFSGESLKTSPRDYPKDHPEIIDLRRIDFIAVSKLTQGDVTRADAVSRIIGLIRDAKPLMRFLCGAIDVPY